MNTSKIKTMKKEDAIKYLQQLYPNGGYTWLDEQRMEAITMAIEALSIASLPSNLEEAAKKYGTEKHPMTTIGANESANDFKAGAKWMASQGAYFEDVIEMCYCNKKPMGLSGDNISITNEIQTLMQSHGIGDGDKVIIQIRKK